MFTTNVEPCSGLILRADADASVPHRQAGTALQGLHREVHGLARPELERVGQQVGDHIVHAQLVEAPRDGPGRFDGQRTPHGRLKALEAGGDLSHELHEIQRLPPQRQASGGDPGDVQQVLDELGEAVHLPGDDLKLARQLLRLGRGTGGCLGQRPHALELERGERRLQLVGGDGEELIPDTDGDAGIARGSVSASPIK
jgi:hypothetical protein